MVVRRGKKNFEHGTLKGRMKAKKPLLFVILSIIVGFLVFVFLTIFDYVYPPVDGKHAQMKKKERIGVVLYFCDTNERFLVPEKRFIPKETEQAKQAKEVVQALIAGSKTGLVNTLPDGVEVLNVSIKGDTAIVDFNKALLHNHPGGSAAELATVYSIVNSVTENVLGVKKVKILVSGTEVPSIKGHVDITQPFSPNRELIALSKKEE
ncbi:MAG: GerMN domain-containing protein [Syntrophales bacterium]|nr:GerMN domain-containing protein [Syntrophales bacterium]